MKQLKLASFFMLLASTQVAMTQTLEESVQEALHFSPEFKANQYQANITAQEVREKFGGFLPKMDLSAGVGYEETKSPITMGLENDNRQKLRRKEGRAEIIENVFNGGNTLYSYRATKKKLSAAETRVQAYVNNLIFEVAKVHYDILRQQELVGFARSNYEWHVDLTKLIQKRVNNGLNKASDEYLALERLSKSHRLYIERKRDLIIAETAYFRLTGVHPSNLSWPRAPTASKLPKSLEEGIKIAQQMNPDLLTAGFEVEQQTYEKKKANAAFFPSADIVASAGRNRNLDGLLGPNDDNQFTLKASYNPINGGIDVAKRNQAAFRLSEFIERRRNKILENNQNLTIAWTRWKALVKMLPVSEQRVKAADQTRESYQKEFKLGKRTLIDLLDVVFDYYQALSERTNTVVDDSVRRYEVLNLSGTLIPYLRDSLERLIKQPQ